MASKSSRTRVIASYEIELAEMQGRVLAVSGAALTGDPTPPPPPPPPPKHGRRPKTRSGHSLAGGGAIFVWHTETRYPTRCGRSFGRVSP